MNNIRNFCIIAHIDHGKSTLADRFLEITKTVETRQMQAQYLDQLELERERGITIKMAPVRMNYKYQNQNFILNLIDTPGHSDFSYEVSRALQAVEGGILLVDATQGIQAQTLSHFFAASKAQLKIIPVINKIDLIQDANLLYKLQEEIAQLVNVKKEEIIFASGKTGEGVEKILNALVSKIPPPKPGNLKLGRALIFDSFYDDHKGIIASIRVTDGEFKLGDDVIFISNKIRTKIKEVGYFTPKISPQNIIKEGEIGYLATGIKNTKQIKIGDTILAANQANFSYQNLDLFALEGFQEPNPVVFVSFYPDNANDYDNLKKSLERLNLNDSALKIEAEQNEILGRGFKVGFLGKLHFEITAERLKREFKVNIITTFPSVVYKVITKDGEKFITRPEELPSNYEEIWEPIIKVTIITPVEYLNQIMSLYNKFRMTNITTKILGNNLEILTTMPLVELISDFDDQLKSATSGFASFSYEFLGYKKANIEKLDCFVAGEMIPGMSRFFPKENIEKEARKIAEKLKNLLPKEQFPQAIQIKIGGKVIAREDIPAIKKLLGNFGKNGGDRTRKMKLWQKQKRGKEKLKSLARVKIEPQVFKELLKK